MEKTRQQKIREKEAEIRKQKFFDPTYDPVFKKIFKNKKNLIHFLNAVLHLEGDSRIKSVDHLKPTVKLRNQAGNEKSGSFDIHARTMCGKFIDVEMQRAIQEDFLDRIELYSMLLSANAKIAMDTEATAKQREEHPYTCRRCIPYGSVTSGCRSAGIFAKNWRFSALPTWESPTP